MLHHGVGEPGDVCFLECVTAEKRNDLLAAEHDDRGRIHLRGEQSRDRVGCARSGRHEHHTGFPGRASVAIGHMGRALFVSSEDEFDSGIEKRIEYRHRGAT